MSDTCCAKQKQASTRLCQLDFDFTVPCRALPSLTEPFWLFRLGSSFVSEVERARARKQAHITYTYARPGAALAADSGFG